MYSNDDRYIIDLKRKFFNKNNIIDLKRKFCNKNFQIYILIKNF